MEVPARWVIRDETGLAAEDLATIPLVLVTAVHAVKTLGELVQEAACWSGWRLR
jgi:NADPH:quinone reductase-like Zn-dependent oxidoreductase